MGGRGCGRTDRWGQEPAQQELCPLRIAAGNHGLGLDAASNTTLIAMEAHDEVNTT